MFGWRMVKLYTYYICELLPDAIILLFWGVYSPKRFAGRWCVERRSGSAVWYRTLALSMSNECQWENGPEQSAMKDDCWLVQHCLTSVRDSEWRPEKKKLFGHSARNKITRKTNWISNSTTDQGVGPPCRGGGGGECRARTPRAAAVHAAAAVLKLWIPSAVLRSCSDTSLSC